MFTFLELSLHRWDCWPTVTLQMDRIINAVCGPNSSGKTTFLDAIRVLLGSMRLSKNRDLIDYKKHSTNAPMLIHALVTNTAESGSRPFQKERIVTTTATLACAIIPVSGGTLERRYAILPEKATVDQITHHLLESKDYYKPEQYSKALVEAGISRGVLEVIALEAHQTSFFGGLKPHQVFDKVMLTLGNQQILTNYREARKKYERADRIAVDWLNKASADRADLGLLKLEVEKREEWEKLGERIKEGHALLDASKLQEKLEKKEKLGPERKRYRTTVATEEDQKTLLEDDLRKKKETLSTAEGQSEEIHKIEKRATEEWGNCIAKESSAKEQLTRLKNVEAEVRLIPEADLDILERNLVVAIDHVAEIRIEMRELQKKTGETIEKIKDLKANKPVYPETVNRTLESLKEAGVKSRLLAPLVEPDPKVASALEAALGDARYAILVDKKDGAKTRDIAKKLKFPGPVYDGPVENTPRKSGPFTLSPGTPEWLESWSRETELRADGSWEDHRGTWLAPANGRVLGGESLRFALKEAEQTLVDLEAVVKKVSLDERAAFQKRQALQNQVDRENHRRQLLDQLKKLPEVESAFKNAFHDLEQAKSDLDKARSRLEEARTETNDANIAYLKIRQEFDTLIDQMEGDRKHLAKLEAEIQTMDLEIKQAEHHIRPDLLEKAKEGALSSPLRLQADIDEDGRKRTNMGEPPPPEVKDQFKRKSENAEESESEAKKRRVEATQSFEELGKCRGMYIEDVNATLTFYAQRLQNLGMLGSIEVKTRIPHIIDNDQAIDDAEIEIELGFDGKTPTLLGSSSFSEGQGNINGLLLIMSMADVKGPGFFILDEPFGSLDPSRVGDVGRFMKTTKAQFILALPSTYETERFDATTQLIVTYKKGAGQTAPFPSVYR